MSRQIPIKCIGWSPYVQCSCPKHSQSHAVANPQITVAKKITEQAQGVNKTDFPHDVKIVAAIQKQWYPAETATVSGVEKSVPHRDVPHRDNNIDISVDIDDLIADLEFDPLT